MKKSVLALIIAASAIGVYALSLESVPSHFGPMSLSPFLDSWKSSIEAEATSQTAAVSANADAITAITPVFDTNAVVVATDTTPTALGQLLVGATNLYVAVGLTTNDWLQIK